MQSQRKFTTLKQSCRTFAKKCNLALNWQTIIVQKISSTHCNISSTVIHEWLLYFSRVEGKTFPSMGFGINYGPWCCHLSIQAASSHQETNSGHIFPEPSSTQPYPILNPTTPCSPSSETMLCILADHNEPYNTFVCHTSDNRSYLPMKSNSKQHLHFLQCFCVLEANGSLCALWWNPFFWKCEFIGSIKSRYRGWRKAVK